MLLLQEGYIWYPEVKNAGNLAPWTKLSVSVVFTKIFKVFNWPQNKIVLQC